MRALARSPPPPVVRCARRRGVKRARAYARPCQIPPSSLCAVCVLPSASCLLCGELQCEADPLHLLCGARAPLCFLLALWRASMRGRVPPHTCRSSPARPCALGCCLRTRAWRWKASRSCCSPSCFWSLRAFTCVHTGAAGIQTCLWVSFAAMGSAQTHQVLEGPQFPQRAAKAQPCMSNTALQARLSSGEQGSHVMQHMPITADCKRRQAGGSQARGGRPQRCVRWCTHISPHSAWQTTPVHACSCTAAHLSPTCQPNSSHPRKPMHSCTPLCSLPRCVLPSCWQCHRAVALHSTITAEGQRYSAVQRQRVLAAGQAS